MGLFERLIDRTLDASVVGGYSRIGYALRSRFWKPIPAGALNGRTVVVTGPTSGLGLATAKGVRSLGADLVLVGRSVERLEALREELSRHAGGDLRVVVADMGDLDAVESAAKSLRALGKIDVLVHNAGSLTKKRAESPQGIESTIATHVLGPHRLTASVLDVLAGGRVITVSSGGMYTSPLPKVSAGRSPEMALDGYDGTKQYAVAKRMQVTLNEMWAERVRGVAFHAMHPGWADTPGVRTSLPGFARVTAPVLRTADEGADTIVWLAAAEDSDLGASGGFWCDRERRPIHRLATTRRSDSPSARIALWQWVAEKSGATEP
jgi:NAD(P)-dependent dehydrogenase (short-subunit alcohol dehydrogenase family)